MYESYKCKPLPNRYKKDAQNACIVIRHDLDLLYKVKERAFMYKLVPTREKVNIKWIVWHGSKKDYRSNEVKWGSGYDFECSCGYASNYGAGTIPTIKEEIQIHKVGEHKYKLEKR